VSPPDDLIEQDVFLELVPDFTFLFFITFDGQSFLTFFKLAANGRLCLTCQQIGFECLVRWHGRIADVGCCVLFF